jgi:hypothetical protein
MGGFLNDIQWFKAPNRDPLRNHAYYITSNPSIARTGILARVSETESTQIEEPCLQFITRMLNKTAKGSLIRKQNRFQKQAVRGISHDKILVNPFAGFFLPEYAE